MATGERSVCARCGATHRFDDLVVIDVIDRDHLRVVVTSWRSGAVVEVRRCPVCSATIARFRAAAGRRA